MIDGRDPRGRGGYRFECWRHGFLGKVEAHPLRRIQTLIRYRGADSNAIERFHVLNGIRAELAAKLVGG